MKRILIIENDTSISIELKAAFELDDFEVLSEKFNNRMPEYLKRSILDFIIIDTDFPGHNPAGLINELIANHNEVPILLITDREEMLNQNAFLKPAVQDFLLKPFSIEELIMKINLVVRGTERKPMETNIFDTSEPVL